MRLLGIEKFAESLLTLSIIRVLIKGKYFFILLLLGL